MSALSSLSWCRECELFLERKELRGECCPFRRRKVWDWNGRHVAREFLTSVFVWIHFFFSWWSVLWPTLLFVFKPRSFRVDIESSSERPAFGGLGRSAYRTC